MKKINALAALAALSVVISCDPNATPTPEPEVTFALAESNVEVTGLDYDAIVEVEEAQINIYANYLDRENVQALDVAFVGLEDGVTVNYSQVYNYLTGPQTVTFTKKGKDFVYAVAVVLGNPEPKFIDLTVAGQSVTGSEIKLSGSTNLTELPVEFVVSPSDAKVFVGTNEIASGDKVDFSDKVNGVTFEVKVGTFSASKNVKVVTTGISSVTRVWGHYVQPASMVDDWFGTKVTGVLDCIRNVAMSDDYIFLSKDRESADGLPGVYAVSLLDPSNVKLLSQRNIPSGERFFSIAVLENTVLAASFVMAAGGHFRLYKYDSVTSVPEVVLDYVLPSAMRLGDKITTEGTWQNGKIWAYDNTSAQKFLCFEVKGGKISATPTVVDLDTKKGNYGAFYKYAEGKYMWGGSSTSSAMFSVSGTTANLEFELPTASYAVPAHGFQFFTINEENYMGYVILQNSFQDGQFRITPLPKATIQESIESVPNPYVYWLGDPESKDEPNTGKKNGNGLGSGAYRVIRGHNYYVAYVPGAGISLFEIK